MNTRTNEYSWLRSIGCQVVADGGAVIVSHPGRPGPDFNFADGIGFEGLHPCIRFSGDHSLMDSLAAAYSCGRRIEPGFDINMIRRSSPSTPTGQWRHESVRLDEWRGSRDGRCESGTEYFHYVVDRRVVGWYSLLRTPEVCGIYDVEVAAEARGRGIGGEMISTLPPGAYFLQTWSENVAAIRAYMSAGFRIHELLFRACLGDA